jgi:hypothetical protein
METEGGSVNLNIVGPSEDLKAALDLPTNYSLLTQQNCEARTLLREACKNNQNCFEFQNLLWLKETHGKEINQD